MYVNTNILLLIYNVYNYDYSFGENKNKRTLLVKLKVILCAYELGNSFNFGNIRFLKKLPVF